MKKERQRGKREEGRDIKRGEREAYIDRVEGHIKRERDKEEEKEI